MIVSLIIVLSLPIFVISETQPLFNDKELEEIHNAAFCFQDRFTKTLQHGYCGKKLEKLVDNFCDFVQCEPVNCDELERVEGITGHGCCAACIRQLAYNAPCTPGSVLEQCQNGLECSLSKHRCDLPPGATSMPCLIEYQNRNFMRGKGFYIKNPAIDQYVSLPYAKDIRMPVCSSVDGSYEQKQTTPSKSFCVDPRNGEARFGVADHSHKSKATCRCTQAMSKLFQGKDPTDVQRDIFKDTHIRCDSTGNFASLSCVNETCLCLDESTGQPKTHVFDFELDDPSMYDENGEEIKQSARLHQVRFPSVAIFGALATLNCFDEERASLKGKESSGYYMESCQLEMHRISQLEEYFRKKGTNISHNSAYPCGFDDRFDRKQCKDSACHCSSPEGSNIGSFGIDQSQQSKMDCRCALEKYLSSAEKSSFDNFQCSGEGNFAYVQCFNQQGNLEKCQCFDLNGMAISEPLTCEVENLRRWGLVDFNRICQAMAEAIKNDHVLGANDQIYLNSATEEVAQQRKYNLLSTKPISNTILCQKQ